MDIIVKHGGKKYLGVLMVITDTKLGKARRDDLAYTASLGLRSLDTTQTYTEGYYLTTNDNDKITGTAYGLDFIVRMMEVAGANTWEGMRGRVVYALYEGAPRSPLGRVCDGLAHHTKDKVFIFKDHRDEWAGADAAH